MREMPTINHVVNTDSTFILVPVSIGTIHSRDKEECDEMAPFINHDNT